MGIGARALDAGPGGRRLLAAVAVGSDRVMRDEPLSGEISIRVRYAETDRMGLLHHANYLVYFEQGRTGLLREFGLSYRDLEDQGFLLVLTKIDVHYRRPARYDDVLTLRTTVVRTTMVRIDHRYELFCDGQLL